MNLKEQDSLIILSKTLYNNNMKQINSRSNSAINKGTIRLVLMYVI